MLRYEMPVVYYLIRQLCTTPQGLEPDWRVIDSVARASKDASYHKPKFRRYLEEYKRDGLYCRRGKKLTSKRKVYYKRICRKKVDRYIHRNRMLLQAQSKSERGGDHRLREMKNMIKLKR